MAMGYVDSNNNYTTVYDYKYNYIVSRSHSRHCHMLRVHNANNDVLADGEVTRLFVSIPVIMSILMMSDR